MRERSLAIIMAGVLASGPALAQANLRPDPTPRVPAQPGQGLPQEDQAFLRRAARLGSAVAESARLGVEKASDPELKRIGQEVRETQLRLQQTLEQRLQQAARPGAPPASQAPADWEKAAAALKEQSGANFDRAWLQWQAQAHTNLTELYQAEASDTPDNDLAKFAIIALAEIRKHFDELRQAGTRYGLSADVPGQPWQY
jgi:putative membrane protein